MEQSNITNIEFHCNETMTTLKGRFIKPSTNRQSKIPIVIILTGDGPKGSKSSSWSSITEQFSENGIASFLFDFQGLGFSDGERKTLTLTKGIANFKTAFKKLKEQDWVDINNIGVLASSFGANVLLLCPEIANQTKAIGLKSPSCFLPDAYVNEIGEKALENWYLKGFNDENGYNIEVLTDCFKYNTYSMINKIYSPVLITHGTKDEIVPIKQSIYLFNLLQSEKYLEKFPEADHGYSQGNSKEKMNITFNNWFIKKLAK